MAGARYRSWLGFANGPVVMQHLASLVPQACAVTGFSALILTTYYY